MNVVIRAVSMSFSREMCSSLESEHGVAIIVATLRFLFTYFEVSMGKWLQCVRALANTSFRNSQILKLSLKLLLELNEVVKYNQNSFLIDYYLTKLCIELSLIISIIHIHRGNDLY